MSFYHSIYKIDVGNGYSYFGKHSTNFLFDGYAGSGASLSKLRNTGITYVYRKILCLCPTEQSAFALENLVIKNEKARMGDYCLNQQVINEDLSSIFLERNVRFDNMICNPKKFSKRKVYLGEGDDPLIRNIPVKYFDIANTESAIGANVDFDQLCMYEKLKRWEQNGFVRKYPHFGYVLDESDKKYHLLEQFPTVKEKRMQEIEDYIDEVFFVAHFPKTNTLKCGTLEHLTKSKQTINLLCSTDTMNKATYLRSVLDRYKSTIDQ